MHYDETVRNAAGGIVQFRYGDDGMDPVIMEGSDGKPLNFDRLLSKVGHVASLFIVSVLIVCFVVCLFVDVGEAGRGRGKDQGHKRHEWNGALPLDCCL